MWPVSSLFKGEGLVRNLSGQNKSLIARMPRGSEQKLTK